MPSQSNSRTTSDPPINNNDNNDIIPDPPAPFATRLSQAFAIAAVLPVMYAISFYIFIQLYSKGALSSELIPLYRVYFNVQPKDIPNLLVLVHALLAFGISGFTSTVFRTLSVQGFDNAHPRTISYTGLAARAVACHQNLVEGLPLTLAAVLLSAQAGVSVAIRSQFAAYALIARVVYVPLYYLNIDFLRSLVWMSYAIPCLLLVASAVIPGFAKEYLQMGMW